MAQRSLTAQYPGTCRQCGGRIDAGRTTITLTDAGWVCCPEGAPAKVAVDWSTFAPSPYQQEVKRLLARTRSHLVIEAVAGGGKTTTLEWLFATSLQGVNAVFAAFNRSIADELGSRLGADNAATLSSIGHRLCVKALGRGLDVKTGKYRWLAAERFPWQRRDPKASELSLTERHAHRCACRLSYRLAAIVRGDLTDPHDQAAIRALMAHHGVETNGAEALVDDVLAHLPRLLERGVEQAQQELVIDYDDQLWLPARLNIPARCVDVLCVDEAQDLNAAQHALVLRLIGRHGRVIAVGDAAQAIYGFRGALSDSLERLSATLRTTDRGVAHAPLSVCYRCPTGVIALAQQFVPSMEPCDGAAEGDVRSSTNIAFLAGLDGSEGWLVLCRVNAPLVAAAFRLLAKGVPCRIQGRDIGEGLIDLHASAAPADDLADALYALRGYVSREVAKLETAGREQQGADLLDREGAIIALSEGIDTVAAFGDRIRELFAKVERHEDDEVVFSSIHRAKGLEAARVAVLCTELLPHPAAKRNWEKEQERNLEYVAYTRSKGTLLLCEDSTRTGGSRAPKLDAPHACALLGGPSLAPLGIDPPAQGEYSSTDDDPEPAALKDYERCRRLADANPDAKVAPVKAWTPPAVSALPSYPAKGDGTYTPPTEDDWTSIALEYEAAGLTAELVELPRWRQWAFCVGHEGRAWVRVSTTVECGNGGAREKGKNAIDIVACTSQDGPPCGGKKKVLRRAGWKGRAAQRINELLVRYNLAHK